jgi:PAS domain S-box-containing protein
MSSADWQNTPFTLPLVLSGLLCGWVAYVAWRRRAVPGAAPLALLLAALAAWALVNLVEKSLVHHDLRRAVAAFVYVFIVTVPGAWLVFAARFARRDGWLPRRLVRLLFLEPVLIVALTFTNSYHGLIHAATEMRPGSPYAVMVITHGPFFYVNAAYTYLVCAAGAGLLVAGMARQPGRTGGRLAVVLGAMLVPVLGNVAYVFRLQPHRLTDLTPVYFAVPGLAAAWLLFRVRVFDVLPIARDFVLDCLDDAVFVLDTRFRLLDANLAALSLLADPRQMQKQPLADAIPELGPCLPTPGCAGRGATEIQLGSAGAGRSWDVHVLPLVDRGVTIGVLVRLTDVTERRRAAEDRSQLAALVASSEDAIIGLTLDGVIVSWNPGAERLYGYSAADVRGRPFSLLFPPDHPNELSGTMEQLRLGKRAAPGEVVHVRKDGRRVDVSLSLSPVKDVSGAVTGAAAIGRDVTDRKRAEAELYEAEGRFRQLAESINEVFWMTDPQVTEILYVSPAYERIWGRSCQSLYEQPRSFLDAVHPDDRQRVRVAALEKHSRGEATDEEYRVVRPDGSVRWVRDRAFPVRDAAGRVYRMAGIAYDVTEQRRAEEALKEADRRKDEFLAMLAHELRNPLAPIRNALHIMKMPGVDAATVERSREMMGRQVQQLVRLVDDLLDVSRVTRGKIELRKENVELASVVARAVETAQPLIEAQGHELTICLLSESLPLRADPVRLAQVISNLLANAAKYTEAHGRIGLTAQREGDAAVLRVRDNGIGIAPDMLSRIFELFVQAEHATTRSQGGLGIGLTLVKSLVERHHGTVEAHSPGLGQGSEFVVRLPLTTLKHEEPSESENGEPPQRAASPSGQRLLVVDDNKDAADSLAMLLRLRGHEVRVAYDGSAALQLVKGYRPDLVFLDIGMPDVDGWEVARRLRRQPGLENVRLAALTGYGQEEDRRLSREAGIDHHLVKPVDPEALAALLAGPEPPAR